MRYLNWISVVSLAVMLFASVAAAQVPEHYSPGQTITISLKFRGPGADQITIVSGRLIPTTPELKDQEGFQRDIRVDGTKTGPNTFKLSFPIKDNSGSGTYHIDFINAGTGGESPLWVVYKPEQDYPDITFKVENRLRFSKPKIEDFTVIPKP